jgi:hypothetical protein
MCSLDVQQTVCCNDLRFRCAAKLVAYIRNATPRCMPRCMRFRCHFLFPTYIFDLTTKKRTLRCVQRDVAFVQRNVTLHGLLQCLLHSV